ncbi:protein NPGR2 isoform X2 [Capsicum annuum]|uniref:protein NPGR2 isoform X2 n=1 Tax=Capsicum annuum TaxID=4072 RepID=UPI001FB18A85|nr:protein NPGR2 isoform X2 [Capsicum annuum]
MGRPQTSLEVRKIMDCLRSSEQIPMDELVPSPESPATKDYISSVHSSRAGEAGQKPDTGNIEGAESSLRESGCLNYEEARALLGRYEYQKGNLEAALLVFEGIDIALVTPNLKLALAERVKTQKRRSQSFSKPTLSIHAVSVLLEAVFLKAKFLQALQRYKGLLNQSKGLYKAALEDYSNALAVYPSHVSSLVSSAVVLRKIGCYKKRKV